MFILGGRKRKGNTDDVDKRENCWSIGKRIDFQSTKERAEYDSMNADG